MYTSKTHGYETLAICIGINHLQNNEVSDLIAKLVANLREWGALAMNLPAPN